MAMPDYPALARSAGDRIDVESVPKAGHFDFVEEPDSEAFNVERRALIKLVSGLCQRKSGFDRNPVIS